jgi:DNA repair protein RecO (recombination protein O)
VQKIIEESVTGIVLRYIPVGEADRLVIIVTRERGKFKCLARGIRKPTSKLCGFLEPMHEVSITVQYSRLYPIVKDVRTLGVLNNISNNVPHYLYLMYISELLDSFIPEEENNIEIFKLYKFVLQIFNNVHKVNLLILFFQLKLLMLCGYGPELLQCVECTSVLKAEDQYFGFLQGGIVCPNCMTMVDRSSFNNIIKMNLQLIKLLRLSYRETWDKLQTFKVNSEDIRKSLQIINNYIEYVVDRKIKSAQFIQFDRI